MSSKMTTSLLCLTLSRRKEAIGTGGEGTDVPIPKYLSLGSPAISAIPGVNRDKAKPAIRHLCNSFIIPEDRIASVFVRVYEQVGKLEQCLIYAVVLEISLQDCQLRSYIPDSQPFYYFKVFWIVCRSKSAHAVFCPRQRVQGRWQICLFRVWVGLKFVFCHSSYTSTVVIDQTRFTSVHCIYNLYMIGACTYSCVA